MRYQLAIISAALLATLMFPDSVIAQDAKAELHHSDDATELDEIIVLSTRSVRRLQDEPVRVEVLGLEEIEEKLLMRPGNISMLLAETGGLRVQVTSPSLGAANIRVQGLRGRYTQLLADGLPLYGGQASSLGLLQIPPSDLRQVEVIKGAASALYGGQALGGVINLISRRPGDEAEGEIVLNATSREGQDLSAYGVRLFGGAWGGSVLISANRQTEQDIDGDGWIDMAGFERISARPRLFWDGQDGSSLFLTLGAMTEDRRGGTIDNRLAPDGQPFEQNQGTRRIDGGAVVEHPLGDWGVAQFRASGVSQSHRHRFGSLIEKDEHQTLLVETSVAADAAGSSFVGGFAYQTEDYTSEVFPDFDFQFETPALFAQVERELTTDLVFAASARWDEHSTYGGQFSPRLSLLYKPGPWTVRASWGQGFYAPTPFVEETEASGLSRLEPLSGLREETAETASLDLGYAAGPWEMGVTLFASDIEDAVRLQTTTPDRVRLVNVDGVTQTRGIEALARWKYGPWVMTGSYLYVDANEPGEFGIARRDVPLTPHHSAGFVAMWEEHDRGRIGFEAYYTGEQPLDNNPYRTESDSYLELGLLGEVVLGRYRLFLNLENLLDVRQTRDDPLTRPQRAPDGSWTVDAWAPLEGFTANAGIRIKFGG